MAKKKIKKSLQVNISDEAVMALEDVVCRQYEEPSLENPVTCECKGKLFLQVIRLKRFPAVHPDNVHSTNGLKGINTYVCVKCWKELTPEDVEKGFEKEGK